MDIFGSDKAPYAFVLLVSVLGWLLTNAVSEGRKHTILTYSADVVTDGGQPYYQLRIENDSVELPISGVSVEITCPDAAPGCLAINRPRTGRGIGVRDRIAPWSIDLQPTSSIGDTSTFSAAPVIPAGASITIVVGLTSLEVKPELFFRLNDANSIAPDISAGFSVYGFVFRNYLALLMFGGGASVLLLVLWTALTWAGVFQQARRHPGEAMG